MQPLPPTMTKNTIFAVIEPLFASRKRNWEDGKMRKNERNWKSFQSASVSPSVGVSNWLLAKTWIPWTRVLTDNNQKLCFLLIAIGNRNLRRVVTVAHFPSFLPPLVNPCRPSFLIWTWFAAFEYNIRPVHSNICSSEYSSLMDFILNELVFYRTKIYSGLYKNTERAIAESCYQQFHLWGIKLWSTVNAWNELISGHELYLNANLTLARAVWRMTLFRFEATVLAWN